MECHKLLLLPCGYALPRTSRSLQFRVRVMNCSVLTEDSDCRCTVAEGNHAKINQPTISLVQVINMADTMLSVKAVWVFPIKGNKNRILIDPGLYDGFQEEKHKQPKVSLLSWNKIMSAWNKVGIWYCRDGATRQGGIL